MILSRVKPYAVFMVLAATALEASFVFFGLAGFIATAIWTAIFLLATRIRSRTPLNHPADDSGTADELFSSDRDLAAVLEEVGRLGVRLLMQAAVEAGGRGDRVFGPGGLTAGDKEPGFGRPWGQFPHIHIGPISRIPVL